MKKTIWVNTIVNNEENFIYFAIMSIVNHVDKVLVWDSGSEDKTVEVIKEIEKIKGEKILFKEVGKVNEIEFTKMRQKMLNESDSDWILILDGDEIWWEESIKRLRKTIDNKGDRIDGIYVPMILPVGDIYHIQEEKAGKYQIHGKIGNISLKAINKKIPGLHVESPYGKEGYIDENNIPVQERENLLFLDAPLLHMTHLKRSSVRRRFEKFKIELGKEVPKNFAFPEVFYRKYPSIIPSPWKRLQGVELFKAKLLTPIRKLKRSLYG